MLFPRCGWLIAACVVLLAGRESAAQFSSLAARVPSDANALVLLDVEKVVDSPAGVAGNWKTKMDNAFASGITLVPPASQRAIFASQLDLEFMAPSWQAVMVQMDSAPSTADIAKRTGGTPDEIGRFSAVRLPQDAYVVHFQDKVYGIMTPANRQAVGKWVLQVAKRTEPELSPYLMEAYRFANDLGTPVIMAIDLEHALSESEIRSRLKDRWREAGLAGTADPLAVAHVIAGMRGVTLGITLRDKPYGKIKIDFTEDASVLAPVAKPLFLAVLDHRGLHIDDFVDWKYEAKGKQVTLEGNLSSSALRRLFSVFDRPPVLSDAPANPAVTTSTPQTKEQMQAQATLAYFQQIQHLLKDLKGEKQASNTYSMGSIAQWCDNYARKIGVLPMLNVDPEMLAYGAGVAKTLGQASLTLRGGGVKGSIDANNVQNQYTSYNVGQVYGYTSRWNLWNGYSGAQPVGWESNVTVVNEAATQDERVKARNKARSESAMQARQILSNIDPATLDIRSRMTQKYQIEFK